jgi:hypothetical protein
MDLDPLEILAAQRRAIDDLTVQQTAMVALLMAMAEELLAAKPMPEREQAAQAWLARAHHLSAILAATPSPHFRLHAAQVAETLRSQMNLLRNAAGLPPVPEPPPHH